MDGSPKLDRMQPMRTDAPFTTCGAWSPCGVCLFVGGSDGHVYRCNTGDGIVFKSRAPLTSGPRVWIRSIACSPKDGRVAACDNDGHVYFVDPVTLDLERCVPSSSGVRGLPATCLAWSPCGLFLAVGYASGRVSVFGTRTNKPVVSWKVHPMAVTDVMWRPKLFGGVHTLASSALDGSIIFWSLQTMDKVGVRMVPASVSKLLAWFRDKVTVKVPGSLWTVIEPERAAVRRSKRIRDASRSHGRSRDESDAKRAAR